MAEHSRTLPILSLIVLALCLASSAHSIPIVSVDMDPSTAGIQNQRTVTAGDTFDVDIVIADVIPPDPLTGFEVELRFDGALLRALSAATGDFLPTPTFELENTISASTVSLASISTVLSGALGGGTLATISFQATAPGYADLLLGNIILSAPFGVAIPYTLQPARISVAAIPEPHAAVLFAAGLLVARIYSPGRRANRSSRKI